MTTKSLVESYTDIIVSEKESRLKRLKDRAKKAGKKALGSKKRFWKDAWSTGD